jgi:hypothetical protein
MELLRIRGLTPIQVVSSTHRYSNLSHLCCGGRHLRSLHKGGISARYVTVDALGRLLLPVLDVEMVVELLAALGFLPNGLLLLILS